MAAELKAEIRSEGYRHSTKNGQIRVMLLRNDEATLAEVVEKHPNLTHLFIGNSIRIDWTMARWIYRFQSLKELNCGRSEYEISPIVSIAEKVQSLTTIIGLDYYCCSPTKGTNSDAFGELERRLKETCSRIQLIDDDRPYDHH